MSTCFLAKFVVLTVALVNVPQCDRTDDFKFEIVSVKALNEAESKKIAGPDFIGADVLVRLRLSAMNRDLFFSGFKQLKIPVGHRIKWEGDEKRWLTADAGVHGQRKSPGIGGLRLSVEWFKLEKGKTVEWELMDGTHAAGELHGESTFIKFQQDEKPFEIFSDSYQVPRSVKSKNQTSIHCDTHPTNCLIARQVFAIVLDPVLSLLLL